MIPKKIHYCWFGHGDKSKLAKKCIKSWKKYCPDYEIIEWNENNFDISSAPLYARQAYEAKKWAFVSDYARFEILYKYGGVYLDTDVELLKPIDKILDNGPAMGCEVDGKCDMSDQGKTIDLCQIMVNPGLIMIAESGMEIIKTIIDDYASDHFKYDDGTYNMRTVVYRVTDILKQRGLKDIDIIQNVAGLYIYPKEYFCPKDYFTGEIIKTKNTISIHHYDGSWCPDDLREKIIKHQQLYKKGIRRDKIDSIIHIPNRIGIKLLGESNYERMKKIFKRQ